MILLGALAVLTTGLAAGSTFASGDDMSAPPCHEVASHHQDAPSGPDPADPVRMADCCVACVAAPPLQAPSRARPAPPRPTTFCPPLALPAGERPAPEPHPPRRQPD